jgi:hypothetical protein
MAPSVKDGKRCLFLATRPYCDMSIFSPIDHALELLGSEGTVIRFDSSVPVKFASHFHLANETEFFDSLPNRPPGSRVDWFVAVYTALPLLGG